MAIDIVVPTEQEGTKATVKAWLKAVGEPVRIDEPLVELETDKVAVEIAATADGVLSEILVAPDTEVEPGTLLGRIAPARAASATGAAPLPPGIRRLLAEYHLDAADLPLTGAQLTREDIMAEAARRAKKPGAPQPGVTPVPHTTMRKRIAEHMARSLQTAPHVTALFEADFSAILAHRRKHKEQFAANGANLTLTAYFIAASAAAMAAAPAVNGRWFDDRIDIYDDVNIGVGTALGENGLIVPVVHRVQTLSLLEIGQRLTELTDKARGGRLAATDVQGGTFSISNHGVSGSLLAAPIIINQPQSAILGIGKLQKRAVVREENGGDAVEIRPMAYVTLTIDHRAIDAHQTNAWLMRFVEVLERWPDGPFIDRPFDLL